MNITLSERQTKELIKKYYEEVEGIKVEIQFTKYKDYQYTDIQLVISKDIELGGIKVKATEDVPKTKLTEVINHYLPADYNFKKVSFNTKREYDYDGDYVDRISTLVELEPVEQKRRERQL